MVLERGQGNGCFPGSQVYSAPCRETKVVNGEGLEIVELLYSIADSFDMYYHSEGSTLTVLV